MQFFADRLFLAETIPNDMQGPFAKFSGHTPFVHEGAFAAWLDQQEPLSSSHANWQTYTATHRDILIDRLKNGELKPEEAEAEAKKLGIEPLETRPDPAKFNPMKETYWTYPMILAWIARRSSDAVREQWNAFRSECWELHLQNWRLEANGAIHKGWILEQRKDASLSVLRIGDSWNEGRERQSIREAEADV